MLVVVMVLMTIIFDRDNAFGGDFDDNNGFDYDGFDDERFL